MTTANVTVTSVKNTPTAREHLSNSNTCTCNQPHPQRQLSNQLTAILLFTNINMFGFKSPIRLEYCNLKKKPIKLLPHIMGLELNTILKLCILNSSMKG